MEVGLSTSAADLASAGTGDRPAPATLGDRVYEQLLRAILNGEIAPGSHITEVELARRFGVSRGPLREAIRKLEQRRLVVHTVHVGARVVEMSMDRIIEVFLVREAMEGMAARLAAQRMTEAEIDGLANLLDVHAHELSERSVYAQYDGDQDFHCRIASGARNDLIEELLSGDLYYLLRLYRAQHSSSPDRGERALVEHRRIVDAIRDRDGELAEMLMRRHIANARLNLEDHLRL